MSLNFEVPYETLPVGKGSIQLRALNGEDTIQLIENYLDDIKAVLTKHGQKSSVPSSQLNAIIMDIAKSFPSMAVEIISRAAESVDIESMEKIRKLSFMKQIAALRIVFKLSTEDSEDELKNFGAVLVSLLESRGIQLGPLTARLQTIINQSENQLPSSKRTAT